MPFPHRLALHQPVVRHDSALGHAFVPNVRVRVSHERGSYVLRTNSQGYRDDRDHGPRTDAIRVVVHGDSFAAGDGVTNGERFTSHLAQQLGVEVINMAVSGFGPDQNVLLAEAQPVRDADVILWCVAAHTIDRIQRRSRVVVDHLGRMRRVPRPHFQLNGEGLRLMGVPVPDDRPWQSPSSVPAIEPLARIRLRALRGHVRSVLGALRRFLGRPKVDSNYARADSPGWLLLRALVARFRAEAGDVPVVLVPLPSRSHISRASSPNYRERFAGLHDPRGGHFVLDVLPHLLAASRAERRRYCYSYDGHYTPEGHAAMASAIQAELERVGAENLFGHPFVPSPPAANGFVKDRSRAPSKPRTHCGEPPYRLEASWDFNGSRAKLVRVSDDEVCADVDEASVAGFLECLGATPFTALSACLEQARVLDTQIDEIVLISPSSLDSLASVGGAVEQWPRLAAPWIRWHGAGEIDLRQFLRFSGLVRHEDRGLDVSRMAPPFGVDGDPTDDEQRWLEARLTHLARRGQGSVETKALAQLATLWERVTRRARYACLPFPEPLRARPTRSLDATGAGHWPARMFDS